MADELDIPMPRMAPAEPSYRIGRAREPVDATTKRLAMIGGGLGLVLVGVIGVYALTGHRSGGGVPVVQADSRPLRSKPENRGGMQLQGQDDAILSGDAAGKDTLAPPPEQPAPDGLQAQAEREKAAREAAAAPVAAPAPAASAAPPPTAAPAVAAAAPKPAEPAHPPAAPTPASASKVARAPTAAPPLSALGGHALVQLGALDSEQAALAEWQRLNHRMPGLLAGRQPSVQRSDRDGKTYWRLRTGGFVDVAQATAFCAQVRAQGGGCSLASF